MAEPKILYKYLSANGFQRFWDSEKVRFTQLNQLNDPYENRVLDPNADYNFENLAEITNQDIELSKTYLQNDIQTIYQAFMDVQNQIDTEFGILSLSRNPLNLLMWSHYAEEHKGVVIGIDVSDTSFYETGILINPERGNVIYSSIRPKKIRLFEKLHRTLSENGDGYNLGFKLGERVAFDDIFLYKSLDWCYEEEIRIVRDFKLKAGEIIADKNQEIRLFPLPKKLITQIIFGERYDNEKLKCFLNENEELGISFSQASIDDYEYKIQLKPLNKK